MKIFITGIKGLLGQNLKRELDAAGHRVFGIDIEEADISRADQIIPVILETSPDIVIHSAACADLARCEEDPDLAYRVNILGTKNVALACQRAGCAMLYMSTDYIFRGAQVTPHREFDDIGPQSVYAKTKYGGEEYVRSLLASFYIVRTAGLFGDPGKNFVSAILKAARSGKELRVVDDEIANRTYTPDLARAIERLIRTRSYGIFHVANSGACSWYEFALEVLHLAGLSKKSNIQPIPASEYKDGITRPASSIMDMSAYEMVTGHKMRHYSKALAEYLETT